MGDIVSEFLTRPRDLPRKFPIHGCADEHYQLRHVREQKWLLWVVVLTGGCLLWVAITEEAKE